MQKWDSSRGKQTENTIVEAAEAGGGDGSGGVAGGSPAGGDESPGSGSRDGYGSEKATDPVPWKVNLAFVRWEKGWEGFATDGVRWRCGTSGAGEGDKGERVRMAAAGSGGNLSAPPNETGERVGWRNLNIVGTAEAEGGGSGAVEGGSPVGGDESAGSGSPDGYGSEKAPLNQNQQHGPCGCRLRSLGTGMGGVYDGRRPAATRDQRRGRRREGRVSEERSSWELWKPKRATE
ncbi:putative glycine-rich cell wall structural protein 1 [Miscanthus floridulus]|uniref:putative glycine-rich cell wall structural protein 1 n=1 Tax=Miscanthus floridulus TaxID=154761 RepID=UPI0034597FD4